MIQEIVMEVKDVNIVVDWDIPLLIVQKLIRMQDRLPVVVMMHWQLVIMEGIGRREKTKRNTMWHGTQPFKKPTIKLYAHTIAITACRP
mmetsp:Transcript_14460/g.16287  ORF Transcript_14460/g.16287 Transcript_14460/m.16287 type:complete len:89 (+) Transcript_14460:2039-2305(+)